MNEICLNSRFKNIKNRQIRLRNREEINRNSSIISQRSQRSSSKNRKRPHSSISSYNKNPESPSVQRNNTILSALKTRSSVMLMKESQVAPINQNSVWKMVYSASGRKKYQDQL